MGSAHSDTAHSGSIRLLLRTNTATDHADVDRRFAALIEAGTAGYRDFLQLSAAAVYPLEQALVRAGIERVVPDWRERSRSAALHADLAELAASDVPVRPAPSLGGEAYQLGVLYVLEGSRLGAKTLLRRLADDPALRPRLAARYLRHGAGRPFWQTFLRRLESSAAVRRSPAEAVAGAHAAFACFREQSPATTTAAVM